MNNFLISGFGRSGTKFLSSVMNMSEKWVVKHEPRDAFEEDMFNTGSSLPQRIVSDFNRNYYGEVNSRLRFYFEDVPVKKKGIIIRDPKEIITSIANRKDVHTTINLMMQVHYFWKKFHTWLEDDNIKKIEFTKMTSDKTYLLNILSHFGIDDVNLDKLDLNVKVNKNKKVKFPTFNNLPNNIKEGYNKLIW